MSPTRVANGGKAAPLQAAEARAAVLGRLGTQVLVCDGAMGTMLHSGGVSLDRALPELSLSQPELVRTIHDAYIAAGAQVIETNTFGASRYRLARHGLEDRVAEINRAGVQIAQEARARSTAPLLLVAGSVAPVTPTGYHLGPISRAELRRAFGEQIAALVGAGIDLLMLETFSSLSEMVEAVAAAREITGVPIVAQMTYVEDGRTLAGDSPAEVAAALESSDVSVIGANCVLGPQGLLDVLRELRRHTDLPLAAQPNAGPPTILDGRFRYTADPAYVARYARSFVELGAALVGGCCGTTPAHIEAVAAAVGSLPPVEHPRKRIARRTPPPPEPRPSTSPVSSSPLAEKLAARTFVVAAELPPPASADAEPALRDAALLSAAGCDAVVVAPGRSTRAQVSSASLALLVQERVPNLEAILTVTTWDRSVVALQADLLGAHAFGLRHVICRSGTPPLQGDYPNVAGIWDIDGLGLSRMLNGLNAGRDHNGASLGRPTAFVIGARIHPAADDFERQVRSVREKIDAGASYLITPPVYDLDALARLLDAVGPVATGLPVLLGLMPLQSFDHAEYLQHEVPDTAVPEGLLQRMWSAGQRGAAVGWEIALEIMAAARTGGYVHGVVVSSATGSAKEMARLLGTVER